jgi:hypothetical protein
MPKKTLILGGPGSGKTRMLLSLLRDKHAVLWDVTEALSREVLEDPAYRHIQVVRGVEIPIGLNALSGGILAVDDLGMVLNPGKTAREVVQEALGNLVKASRMTVSDIIVTFQLRRDRTISSESVLPPYLQDIFDEAFILDRWGQPPQALALDRNIPQVRYKSRFDRKEVL